MKDFWEQNAIVVNPHADICRSSGCMVVGVHGTYEVALLSLVWKRYINPSISLKRHNKAKLKVLT